MPRVDLVDEQPDVQKHALLSLRGEGLSYEAAAECLGRPVDRVVEVLLSGRHALTVFETTAPARTQNRATE